VSPHSPTPSAPPGADGRRVALRPSVEPFAASDGHLYLLKGGATAEHVIRDATPRERALLAALDGPPAPVGEIAAAAGVDADGVDEALRRLAGLGLLTESDGPPRLAAGVRARFDRQLAWLEDRLGDGREVVAAQQRLAAARVCVLGCGGLGTWTAAALACVGVGCLVLVDDDTVELSNLNRQILFGAADVGRRKVTAAAEALRRFDPGLAVEARAERLRGEAAVAGAIAGCDFVVEAADWPPYELPRWVDAACRRHGTPHISAAQHPPLVRIGPLRVPGRSPCLRCVEAHARERHPLLDEVAAFRSARRRPAPTLGPASGLIGTLVATEILHALTRAHEPATLNRSLVFRLDTFESRLEPEPDVMCRHA
jgi:molybdopterin/thiamine biosynthesis adenylyltransferase